MEITHNWEQPPVDARETLLLDDGHGPMNEAPVLGIWPFGVVDQFSPARKAHVSLSDSLADRRTYLIVSEGVTANTASVMPAPRPASRLRGALSFPFNHSSVHRFRRVAHVYPPCHLPTCA